MATSVSMVPEVRQISTRTTTPTIGLQMLFGLALDFAVSMSNRALTLRVLKAVTRFLHSLGIGQTGIKELSVGGHPVLAKLENENATGSYKSRGAYLSVACAKSLGAAALSTASTGNHGAGVNGAAETFAIPLEIYLPKSTPSFKLERLKGPHTTLSLVDGDFAKAKAAAEQRSREHNVAFIAPYDSSAAVCGQASIAIELAALPRGSFDAVVVPIGGGGLCAGTALGMWAAHVDVPIYGVCVRSARAAYDSFHSISKQPVVRPTSPSLAEGVLVESPGQIPWKIMSALVKDIVMVDEDDVVAAIAALHKAGIRAEGAGSLSIAAVMSGQIPSSLPACIISGGNIGDDTIRQLLARAEAPSNCANCTRICAGHA